MKKPLILGVLLLLFLLQLPFLSADPDRGTDLHTRGAWTDEGLYTSQIRNYLAHGEFNARENSTFVRGPLFNVIQYPFFAVFGSKLIVSRLLVLFSILLVLFFYLQNRQTGLFGAVFSVLALTQYHLFHFAHYGLAEIMAISFILAALYLYIDKWEETSLRRMVLAGFFVFCAYSLKIQFLYAAAILPTAVFLSSVKQLMAQRKFAVMFPFLKTALAALAFGLIYGIWYLLNHSFYDYVMGSEVSGRYPDGIGNLFAVARFNFGYFLWVRELKTVWIPLLISLPLTGILLYKRLLSKTEQRILVFAACWIVLELHKLPMTYIPNRYLLSLYLPIIMVYSIPLARLMQGTAIPKGVSALIIVVLLGFQGKELLHSYHTRTYDLQKAGQYLKSCNINEGLALGSWASAINWDTDIRAIPVWNRYFNWENPVETFKPRLVITETNEADAEQTYSQQHIDLMALSDSVKTFTLWRYEIRCYWMKNP